MVDKRPADLRVAVLGTGLIGGSILLGLREAGIDVAGWDPDPEAVSYARQHGIEFFERLADAVAGRDVVVLAGPLSTLPDNLAEVAGHTDPGCVITDVGSVKAPIARYAQANGWLDRFVPGHPMAGSEHSGLTAADPTLFDDAAWVLCPQPGAPLAPFRVLTALITTALKAKVVPLSPETHDDIVAMSSHIPHLLAGSLAGSVARSALRQGVLSLAAGSFRDGTRVAGTRSARTVDMLTHNRDAITKSVHLAQRFLADLADALERDDVAALTAAFDEAHGLRQELMGRDLQPSAERFRMDALGADELDFLTRLGAAGGHLTACAVDGDTVTYTALRPAS
ncbi:prephenate dehydrogenase/arogenate dehydrogenase family protein [Planosporangium flavigriseum]|nr:prephenate dehydrogenase/arogenate dehydrogenase family protein [Planosporangium flavigriseum]NJC67655.1 prephenate dehydrogenase/arogenate dehydrogenase family protein [Planosporangium flavigriseum]